MTNVWNTLRSETGMRVVNGLFFAAAWLTGGIFSLLAAGAWLVFLACAFRRTETSRGVYGVLMVLAGVMLAANLYFFLHACL